MTDSFTPQSSVVSSVEIVEKDQDGKMLAEGTGEFSKARNLERVRNLGLKDLACRRELIETREFNSFSVEDINIQFCVDWLKAHEAHFSREKTLWKADSTGIPKKMNFGPATIDPFRS